MRWSRKPNVDRDARRPSRARPAVEQLESRDVPAAGFLQGTAYLDSNNNGQIDGGDAPHAGAVIQLFKQVGSDYTLVTDTTTDANGSYLFTGLDAPATYLLVCATPDFVTIAASASSQLYDTAVVTKAQFLPSGSIPANTIQVTLVDTSAVQVTFEARPLFERIHFFLNDGQGNDVTHNSIVSQRLLSVTGGGLGSTVKEFYSFCTDLNQDLTDGATWNASTQPTATDLPYHSGEIAYLYNHYGTVLRSSNADAAGLQLAIWELEYDATPDLDSGNFRYGYEYDTPGRPDLGPGADAAAVRSAAEFYLQNAVGSENAIFLRADSTVSGGLQSMISAEAFNFLLQPVPPGSISGTKFNDINGNGARDGTDAGLGGVTIFLDANNDGIFQTDSERSTTTAPDGSYRFSTLAPGTYSVQEVVPPGWTQTAGGYTVTLSGGQDAPGFDFGDFQNITIGGTKFKDLTGNGFSADDTPLGGVTINLYRDADGNGLLTAADGPALDAGGNPISATTAADGTYSFANLGPGTYFVREVVPPGSVRTAGGDKIDPSGNAYYVVPATSGNNATGKNFDNYTTSGSISGTKFLDVTGNGFSSDDKGFGGVTIQLLKDANGDGALTAADGGPVATQKTAADGTYSFSSLGAGTYFVQEVVPDGYVRTGPALASYYTVKLAADGTATGGSATGNNFDNAETCTPDEITCVSFCVTHCDGTTETVSDLRGHTREGDVITVTFFVNVPDGQTHPATFVSYTAPQPYFDANTASQQQIYDIATGVFGRGYHTLTIHVPNCYYQVDFVCGYAIDKLGPAGSNIFYSQQGRLESADNGGTHACCTGMTGTISGYKFNDKNANGTWDGTESALQGVTVFIDGNNNGQLDTGEVATVTDANGFYKFNNLTAGTYRVREVQLAGWVQSAGPSGNDVLALAAGQNAKGVNFGDYKGATVSGYKFNDKNADGVWDENGLDNCSGTADDELAMSGWKIFVDYNGNGQLDAGEPSAVTDANGAYGITGVKAGTYALAEVQQTGWIRTTDDVCLTLVSGGTATNVNIGNFRGSLVMTGDTATIGFWNNKNGQALICSLNGGSTSKALGNWLAATLPNIYGSSCGANNLAGKTNAQVAAYFQTLFNKTGQKLEAQVLATALAMYVTNSTLAGGSYAAKYGFNVDTKGIGGDYYNIGDNGAAFGVVNDSVMTVSQILAAANAKAVKGLLWNGNTTYRNMGNDVFTGINQQGDIT